MWRHLYDPATETHYADGGFIAENAPVPLSGAVWVEGSAPEDALPYREPALHITLQGIFDAQSLPLRIQFAPLKAAVDLELRQGNLAVAQGIIAAADIPAEVETVRQALLDCFPNLLGD